MPARIDFLVVSPPVCTPSEPPSGAFLLASALKARGFEAVLLDLSLEYYLSILEDRADGQTASALDYLRGLGGGFTPHGHRTASGHVHRALGFESRRTGWKTTLMDLEPPCGCHSPSGILELCRRGATPFGSLFERVLDAALDDLSPGTVLVSVSYLSQLAGAVDTIHHSTRRGFRTIAGGSLPNSLRETGEGAEGLEAALGRVEYGDGGSLAGLDPGVPMTRVLAWPDTAGRTAYISPRPVVPFALSTGCYWNRCLFCPDRTQPFRRTGPEALVSLLEGAPESVRASGPVVHLLDSALAPALLEEALPALAGSSAAFYGFARPSRELLAGDLVERAAEAGCAMLQLGVESSDRRLLDSFDKGTDPDSAAEALERISASGTRTYCYFLFGLPGEDGASREHTLGFIEENSHRIDFANLSIFNLPVNCELADRASEFGIEILPLVRNGELMRLYAPFTCSGVAPRYEVRRFLSAARAASTGLRSIVSRTPRWFRAAHLAMLDIEGRNRIV